MGARRAKSIIHFLDLGSGPMAERGFRHAQQHEEHKVVSVDKERSPMVLVDGRGRLIGQRNHRFVEADVFEYLERRKPDSVEVANDDFFLDELLLRHGGEAITQAREGALVPHIASQVRGKMGEYAGAVRRVLTPGGRVSIMLQGFYKAALAEELRRRGFEVSERMLTQDEIVDGDSNSARRALRDFDKLKLKYSKPRGLRMLAPALGHPAEVPADVLASTFLISARKPGGKRE